MFSYSLHHVLLVDHDMWVERKNKEPGPSLSGRSPQQGNTSSTSPIHPNYPQGQAKALLVVPFTWRGCLMGQTQDRPWGSHLVSTTTISCHWLQSTGVCANQIRDASISLGIPIESFLIVAMHDFLFIPSYTAGGPRYVEREEKQRTSHPYQGFLPTKETQPIPVQSIQTTHRDELKHYWL